MKIKTHHSEETKLKMSNARKEYCKNNKEAISGKNSANYGGGNHWTEEAKRKLSETLKGRKFTKTWRDNISKAKKGMKQSEEQINNFKKALQKHHLDLNHNNNQESNILTLSNANHQKFHRYAYHYLLEKFGIEEIMKYYEWFKVNRMKEESNA